MLLVKNLKELLLCKNISVSSWFIFFLFFSSGEWMCRPGTDGGEADDAAAADGGRPAVAGAGGELHGNTHKINSFCQHFLSYKKKNIRHFCSSTSCFCFGNKNQSHCFIQLLIHNWGNPSLPGSGFSSQYDPPAGGATNTFLTPLIFS